MVSIAVPDKTENHIDSYTKAIETLARLPKSHQALTHWNIWCQKTFPDLPWVNPLKQSMAIAYARMTLRNGSLSSNPRSYHNESHINDILLRIMYCADHPIGGVSHEGLAILCLFAACHDLRQAETRKPDSDDSLVGANETASFHEAVRIIDSVADDSLWNEHNLLLLKTMIEGSTFGSGGKRSKNFFQGNLAIHLLNQLQLNDAQDVQLVLLACDLDTANVALPIDQFAQSAIHIYDELMAHQEVDISAKHFFSEQQKVYFFEQQMFNAEITKRLFQPHKDRNQIKIQTLCTYIASLPENLSAKQIKTAFVTKAQDLLGQ